LRRGGGIDNEPDKDRTAGVFEVVTRRGEATSIGGPAAECTAEFTFRVFVKVQSGRGLPLWLQAVRAAVEPGIAREVDFYRRVAATAPLRTPRVYFAGAAHAFNRVCIVLEHVDGYNPADWRGCPLAAVRAILGDVARMNAAFVGTVADDPRTRWIPARAGLDYASFVATLGTDAPVWVRTLWGALERAFRDRPLTLVHGDCRPGNMILLDDGATKRHVEQRAGDQADPWPTGEPLPGVVFTDWEAVNAAPLLWDFTYCTVIGLRAVDRAAHLTRLLDEFLASLRSAGVSPELCDPERARTEVDLLTLALYYVASLVVSKGYWDKQGNTFDDFTAWSSRVLAAVRAVDARRAAKAIDVPVEIIERLQREATLARPGHTRPAR
jgi:hypothetical protein